MFVGVSAVVILLALVMVSAVAFAFLPVPGMVMGFIFFGITSLGIFFWVIDWLGGRRD